MSVTYSAGIATAYGAAVRGGYTGTYEQWCALMADYASVGQAAAASAEAAAASATKSESWAVGGTSSRTGENTNNASYYAGQASGSATAASGSADSASASATSAESWAVGGTSSRSGEDMNNSSYYAGQASTSATGASASATAAESWAVGGTSSRTGEDTDNASYYATQAAASAAAAEAVEESIPEDYSTLSADVVELKATMPQAVVKVISDDITTVTFTRTQLTQGILKPDGTVTSGSAPGYTPMFEVEAGEVITAKLYYVGSDGTIKGGDSGNFRSEVFFASSIQTYTNWGKTASAYSTVTVPENATYAQVTVTGIMTGTYTILVLTRTKQNGRTDYYPVQSTFRNPLRYDGALTANTFQMLGDIFYVDSYIATLTIKVPSSFTSIKFGGANTTSNNLALPYVEVTPTQVIFKSKTDESWDRTETHGLTIADDLQIILIKAKGGLTQDCIIQSGGSRWTSTGVVLRLGTCNYGFGVVAAENITSATASVTVCDLNKPVWVCGDSWVTYYDTRWYYYALEQGFDFLHSGYAGENSADGLTGLKTLLKMYRPKMILWMYGMNDPDTNDSTVNTSWQACLNELKTICANESIELILATVPTTPTMNNNAKNAIVEASGYRYVDEVKAMGADTSGNWITGYQSEDGNHTTALGAKALFARVLADVPEIGMK